MPVKPIQIYEEKELKTKLQQATQILKKAGRSFLPIRGFEAAKGLTIVEMDDDKLEHFADLVTAGVRAFYVWDEDVEDGVESANVAGLRLYLHDGVLLYAWNFLTEGALVPEGGGGEEVDRFGRPLPELTPDQQKLVKRLKDDREGVIKDLVKLGMDKTNAKDLTLTAHKVLQVGETILDLDNIPYGLDVRTYEVSQEARGRIEDALAKRKEDALAALVSAFPDWYSKKGNARVNKALVKMFIDEQGYKCASGFIDDVKVRLDVVLTTAGR